MQSDHRPHRTGAQSPWLRLAWWVSSGATRPRGRSSTCSATSTTWSCATRGGRTPGIRSSPTGVTYKLSLVPTGILRPGIDCVIGNGVVIHPPALLKEIETPDGAGGRLRRPAARQRPGPRDPALPPGRGAADRGVGLGRRPPRDDPARDRPLLSRQGRPGPRRPGRRPLPPRPTSASAWTGSSPTRTACSRRCCPTSSRSTPRRSPTSTSATPSGSGPSSATRRPGCTRPIGRGRRLLFEGAQGSLLDIDHGSYPYVTSSNSSAAGIAAGSGVPTRHIDRWIGIVKAYTTRVGGGPFPTEQDNEIGERIRQVGREYGTVTGRPRRCGWFDAVAVRYSAGSAASTEIAVMLLDVLSGLDELQVAVAYEDETAAGSTSFPATLADLERCRPVYETLPGWSEDLTGVRSLGRPARRGPRLRRVPRPAGRRPGLDRLGRPGPPQTILVPTTDRADRLTARRSASPRIGSRRLDQRRRCRQSAITEEGLGRWTGPRPAARAASPARRHHHGRQRPMGPAPRPAPDRRPPPRASGASAPSSRKAAGSASSSSRSTASRSRTGSGRPASCSS